MRARKKSSTPRKRKATVRGVEVGNQPPEGERPAAVSTLAGQWFGQTPGGRARLDLDKRVGVYSGSAAIFEHDVKFPNLVMTISISAPGADGSVKGDALVRSFFARPSAPFILWQPGDPAIKQAFPDALDIRTASINGRLDNGALVLSYKTNVNTESTVTLSRVEPGSESIIPRDKVTWDEFKARIAGTNVSSLLFRGQPQPWPLRTSFHRAGRCDLYRFALDDVNRLANAVAAATDRIFSTTGGNEFTALLGIAQHHQFPTPLLDWTRSPYVAAYFACREITAATVAVPTVFVFDRGAWIGRNGRLRDIADPELGLAFFEPVPISNPRLVPQQSVLVQCNADAIEPFIQYWAQEHKVRYIGAFEITTDPVRVLKDLRMMGVYAGSMFPGLDGMCRGVFEESLET